MTTRTPSRADSIKAARELLDARAQLIGDLHTARADVDAIAGLTETANAEAEAITADAQRRAAAVIAKAEEQADARTSAYAELYRTARDQGWTAGDLTTLGFTAPRAQRGKRKPADTPDNQGNAEPATDHNHEQPQPAADHAQSPWQEDQSERPADAL